MSDCQKTVTLSENPHGVICMCKCCDKFSFSYKNLFLSLSTDELIVYRNALQSLKKHNFTQSHPEGFKAVFKSAYFAGYVGFTRVEVQEIVHMIREALLLNEIHESLEKTGN